MADLTEKLLVQDQDSRLGANGVSEIKNHPYFANVDFDAIKNKTIKSPLKKYV